jgi:hypothetical protein
MFQNKIACLPKCYLIFSDSSAGRKLPETTRWAGTEMELGWYLIRRAELFHRTADRLRRKAFENTVRTRRL